MFINFSTEVGIKLAKYITVHQAHNFGDCLHNEPGISLVLTLFLNWKSTILLIN